MSNTVDRRVVEMEFDNARFEQKAATTLGTLDKLKKSLDFTGTEKSFEKLNAAAQDVDLSSIAEGVQALQDRFSTMGIVSMQVISRLTNAVMNAGHRMISQIWSGGISRAMNIEQARFQIQGLGKDWEALSKDIDYAVSGTAYGFDEAARAAAQFSASGIEAGDDMKTALRAISGMAAMTNSSYSDISSIFTTVAGNGKLMTQQLRQFSFRGMNVAATLGEQLGKTEQEINEMVTKGQIDFETFAKAMDDAFGEHAKEADKTFTGAMSNVKAALSRIGAAFIQPAITMTEFDDDIWNLVDILVRVKNVFNAFETALKNSKFLEKYLEVLENVSKGVSKFLESFVRIDEEGKKHLKNPFEEGSKYAINFGRTLAGVKSLISAFINTVRNIGTILKPILSIFEPIAWWALVLTSNIADLIVNIHDAIDSSGQVPNIVKRLSSGISILVDILKAVIDIVGTTVSLLIRLPSLIFDILSNNSKLSSGVYKVVNVLKFLGNGISFVVKKFDELLNLFTSKYFEKIELLEVYLERLGNPKIGTAIEGVADLVSGLSEKAGKINIFSDLVSNIKRFSSFASVYLADAKKSFSDFSSSAKEKLNDVSFVFRGFKNSFKNAFSGIIEGLVRIAKAFGEALTGGGWQRFQNLLNASALMIFVTKFTSFIDNLKGAGDELKGTFKDTIIGTFESIKGTFDGVVETLNSARETFKAYQEQLKAQTLLKIAYAIAVLTASLFVLSTIDAAGLAKGLTAITVLFWELEASLKSFATLMEGPGGKALMTRAPLLVTALIGMSTAILLLSASMKVLSGLSVQDIAKGLAAIGALMFMLTTAANALAKNKTEAKMVSVAYSMLVFSGALYVMSYAIKRLGELDPETLTKGVVAISALMLSIAAYTKTAGTISVRSSVGVVVLAGAMLVLAKAVEAFGDMSPEVIAKGLVTITVALMSFAAATYMLSSSKHVLMSAVAVAIIAGAMQLLSKSIRMLGDLDVEAIGKALMALGPSLIVMAAATSNTSLKGAIALSMLSMALVQLSKAIKALGGMKMKQIGKAMVALAGGLLAMTLATRFISGGIVGALGMVVMAEAIRILAPALKMLGEMSLEEIGKSLLTVAGAMVIFGGIAAIFGTLSPLILAFAVAIGLLGAAMFGIGAGVYMFVGAMQALGSMTSAGITAAKEAIMSFGDVIPVLLESVAQGIVGMLSVLDERAPEIIGVVVNLLLSLFQALSDNIYRMTEIGADIIVGFLNGLSSKINDVVDAGVNLIIKFIDGMSAAIVANGPKLISALANLMWSLAYLLVEILRSLLSNLPIVGDQIDKALADVESSIQDHMDANKAVIYGEDYMEGIAEGVSAGTSAVEEAAIAAGQKSGEGFASTIDAAKSQAADAAKNLKDSAKTEVDKAESDFLIAGDYASQGFIKGIKGKIQEAWQAGSDLAGAADRGTRHKAEIQSPSKVFEELGRYVAMGFANGITSLNSKVRSASESMAGASIETMQNAIKAINDSASSDWSQPTIRPVLDLSEIQNGGGRIGAMLNGASLSLGSSVLNARKINAELDKSAAITMANEENLIASQNKVVTALDDLTRLTEQNKLDIDQIYDAVRLGASNATVSVPLNGRELSRGLRDMGVAFK